MKDPTTELAGRLDALTVAVAQLITEMGSLCAFTRGLKAQEERERILQKIEGHLPGLMARYESLGHPDRSKGLEEQIELMAQMVRTMVVSRGQSS